MKPKKLELQNAAWSNCKHHNTVEFMVCIFFQFNNNLSIIMMADKGLNLFGECAAECVYLSPQEIECTSFPEGTIKCTHLAS